MNTFTKKIAALAFVSLMAMPLSARACTLFAANGSVVDGGGTLVGKNRDAAPDIQFIQFNNNNKNAYYGLACGDPNGKNMMTAGVNDKGLVIILAKTSSMNQKVRATMGPRTGIRQALGQCSTVTEVLAHKEFFHGPDYVILADATEIARVEVGDNNRLKVDRVKDGTLAHTNHFLHDEFKHLDVKEGISSRVRMNRIEHLLESTPKPLTVDSFKAFCTDTSDGPDNSLWRTGSAESKAETVFSFVVNLQKNNDFTVWLKYREKPDDISKEKVLALTKKEIFGDELSS